jgi:hypothetical protein
MSDGGASYGRDGGVRSECGSGVTCTSRTTSRFSPFLDLSKREAHNNQTNRMPASHPGDRCWLLHGADRPFTVSSILPMGSLLGSVDCRAAFPPEFNGTTSFNPALKSMSVFGPLDRYVEPQRTRRLAASNAAL